MNSDDPNRTSDAFASEVVDRFGVLPNFFRSAPAAPGLIEELWAFARSAYLDSPLPPVLKERLFVHLSRFCRVRYCIVRHVGFLIGEGRPAGDRSAAIQSVGQALALLRRPMPGEAALDRIYRRLKAHGGTGRLPAPGTREEGDLFDALTAVFLAPNHSARARASVRSAVGDRNFELFVAFLAFVRTAHYWTETHPDLACEPDMLESMERHPELAALLLDTREAEEFSIEAVRRRLVAAETALHESEASLRLKEVWLAAQKEAFQVAMDGGSLEASLGILTRTMTGHAEDGRRCAFYIANDKRDRLTHVVGMPPSYAAAIDGFEISPESLSCGLAVATGQPVITRDVLEERRWQAWTWLAREHDYRACWSFPVETVAGRPIGSFALYFKGPRDAEPADMELAAMITKTAAIIISRHRENEERIRSEQQFRQFGEASRDVLWIRDADTLQWQYLTSAFETIYGLSRDAALGEDNFRSWIGLIVPDDRQVAENAIRRVRRGEHVTFDYRIRRPVDGTIRWLRDTDFPIANGDGKVVLVGGIGHDLTGFHEAELRLQTLMEGIPQLVWRAVKGGQWTWSSPQWTQYTGLTSEESAGSGWLDAVHPDDRKAAIRFWDEAARSGRLEMEGRICHAASSEYRWFQTRATPVRGEGDDIVEWLGTSTDIHDLRELQERQRILVAELQHRTRNLMGVVRSMADKTIRASRDQSDFRDRFRDRLEALARVQGLLSRLNEQDRVAFDELIHTELSAVGGSSDRMNVHGPAGIRLRSSTVQTLAMALHELATNAVKYGALGQPAARLDVTWSFEPSGAGGKPWLHIDWRESGVAMPAPGSVGTGQGRELIERALPYELEARVSYAFGADGIRCTISIPVSETTALSDTGMASTGARDATTATRRALAPRPKSKAARRSG